MKLQTLAVLMIITLCPMACQQKADNAAEVKQPAFIPDEAGGIYRVRLTAAKEEEYKLQMAPVQKAPLGKVVPRSALLLDQAGAAWVFASPEPHLFIRQQVKVKSMDGDQAFLSEGPPVGTEVVAVGADKLLGLGAQ